MPGYRFCRSDDIPLLVAAHNACWVPHFGPDSAITVDDFKRGIREIGLWSSSCMVAFEGDEPIGVLIAAKRDGEANFVHRLAVKPGSERQGHGRHLLTSLVDKAAILGPPRVVAEVPADWTGVRSFLERSGFVVEAEYADFVIDVAGERDAAGVAADLVVEIGIAELVESDAFDARPPRAWLRTPASLRARGAALEVRAITTDRIEAYIASAPTETPGERDVLALGAPAGGGSAALFAALIAGIVPAGGRLRVPALGERELPFATLVELGFRRTRDLVGYVAPIAVRRDGGAQRRSA